MSEKHRHAHDHPHTHKQTKAVLNRLARVEGHVRSIRGMVEDGRDCTDILMQISAVKAAIEKVGKVVLEDHLESCLINPDASPDEKEKWNEVKEALDVYF